MGSELRYAFDNQSVQAVAHHAALSELLDPFSRRRIEELIDLPGRRCLEVAAGGGRLAVWLADRVGPAGRVLATDLEPQHIPVHPGLEVRRHDIVTGEPLGVFDLVHARLLLSHLPERRAALRVMAAALAPGGVLLTEDFWPYPNEEFVAHDPDPGRAALLRRYHRAHTETLVAHGGDPGWGRQAQTAFREEGFEDVRVTVHGSTWPGGGAGGRLLQAALGQLHDELVARGLTEDDLTEVAGALNDPRVALNGYLVCATSGRWPGPGSRS